MNKARQSRLLVRNVSWREEPIEHEDLTVADAIQDAIDHLPDSIKDKIDRIEIMRGSGNSKIRTQDQIDNLKQKSNEAMRSGRLSEAVRLYNQAWEIERGISRAKKGDEK